MRFLFSLSYLLAGGLISTGFAQDARQLILKTPCWYNDKENQHHGFGWSLFSRQYYGVSNWNGTGIGGSYSTSASGSDLIFCRDGIPGLAWYHLYLSHSRHLGIVSGTIQLRFSGVRVASVPPAFRLGANAAISLPVGDHAGIGACAYDLTGWLAPRSPLTRGSPGLRLQGTYCPGDLISLLLSFDMSPYINGPVMAGVRLAINERIALEGLFGILPAGFAIGLTWKLSDYRFQSLVDYSNGLGITPTLLIQNGN